MSEANKLIYVTKTLKHCQCVLLNGSVHNNDTEGKCTIITKMVFVLMDRSHTSQDRKKPFLSLRQTLFTLSSVDLVKFYAFIFDLY